MNFSFLFKKNHFFKFFLWLLISLITFQTVDAQNMDRIEKARMKDILSSVKKQVKDSYYDQSFHGIDIEARFKIPV